jgi:hypothetical protein
MVPQNMVLVFGVNDIKSIFSNNLSFLKANVTDVKKARLLFKSIRETNPKLAPG